ncbi:MAG: sigma-70 family RNA polymerase sigma factor [Spirochaetales bacterium]|nr:sigma-70 family RNA polymerase sigma factor [Spirochaetales bacterium]
MNNDQRMNNSESLRRLEKAYNSDRKRFMSRMRSAGRSLEEAEDMVHDLYAETLERLPLISEIRNLSAWLNSLFTRRMIDDWRHRKVRNASGETDVAEETLREIIAGTGLDPLSEFVRDSLVEALNAALHLLPESQRKVVEAQVFGGKSFREIAAETGENIETLKARKRYAVKTLSQALVHWIDK